MDNQQQNHNNDRFDARKLIKLLSSMSEEDKNKRAKTSSVIQEELRKLNNETKAIISKRSREEAIKYALWQGLLNQYGIFGTKRNLHKTELYDGTYSHGDLISIDFGTSNIGLEFSYTHTAIVLKSYTDYVVVLPTTTIKEDRLESKPIDEQNDTMTITDKDFKNIESDSYILLYQIKSVSKNRIQKVIGNISGTKLMNEIDEKLMSVYLPYIDEEYKKLTSLVESKEKELQAKQLEIEKLQEKLQKCIDSQQNV